MECNPKYSIIVPVYNTELYLRQCIESVLAQSYSNWELILVDDGSTDSSGSISSEYAEKDNRILVRHLKNGGPSKARNYGLNLATGEYILFLDSDDYFPENTLNVITESVQKTSAHIICGSFSILQNGNLCQKSINYKDRVISNDAFLCDILKGNIPAAVWGKTYHKDAIGQIRFNEKLDMGEDFIFNILILTQSTYQITYISKPIYNYRILNQSLTRTTICDIFRQKTFIDIYIHLWNVKISGAHIEVKSLIASNILGMIYVYYTNQPFFKKHFDVAHKSFVNKISEFLCDDRDKRRVQWFTKSNNTMLNVYFSARQLKKKTMEVGRRLLSKLNYFKYQIH